MNFSSLASSPPSPGSVRKSQRGRSRASRVASTRVFWRRSAGRERGICFIRPLWPTQRQRSFIRRSTWAADCGSIERRPPEDRTMTRPAIEGFAAPGFDAARDAFAENFAREGDYREVGASFAAFHRGRCVVDLWGGIADPARNRPWTRDTLANVWSSTKGIVAVAVALCVERGLVRYSDSVAQVWPEFGQDGKSDITLAQVMSHQAGLPGFAEPTTVEDQLDWDACCTRLALQAPAWAAGTATSYHAMTFGWLAGEVVRRVTGASVGTFIQAPLSNPLGADFYIGLP